MAASGRLHEERCIFFAERDMQRFDFPSRAVPSRYLLHFLSCGVRLNSLVRPTQLREKRVKGLNFDLGESIALLRESVRGFAAGGDRAHCRAGGPRQPIPACDMAQAWRTWDCSASPSMKTTAARTLATWLTSWPWKRFRAPPQRLGSRMARIPTCASINSPSTEQWRRRKSICPT